MSNPVVVVGAGGFGRETLDVIEAANRADDGLALDVLGVLDDGPSEVALRRLAARGIEWLGGVEQWLASGKKSLYIVAIGNSAIRASVAARFDALGYQAATVIHPSSTIGSLTEIGAGSVVCAGVQISTNVTLGRHVHTNPSATIGHDAVIADFVSVNPAAVISGDVSVGAATLIGAGAVVLQGLSVGAACVVGASACVTRDVLDGSTVMGVPAR